MNKGYNLNEDVKHKLRAEIYSLEKENQKTKKLSDKAMKEKIVEIIEREVKKCY